ncbi:hypothetical protein KHM83_17485 [Fusibacter paucivorans]|uniref:DUF4829 domain-containing protein n=1 Tax=Fusibacter paucivorans TaxID=76009 RepID=A0ABS5PTS5_9FIRM|nr:hypothetical protein [Fusibacter paucivorans]MBS7528483.1 hypothetical protein [Fusibacter paucivorans]
MIKQKIPIFVMTAVALLSLILYTKSEATNTQLHLNIHQLEEENNLLQNEIASLISEKRSLASDFDQYQTVQRQNDTVFPVLITLADRFGAARIEGDSETLAALLDSKYTIIDEDDQLIAKVASESYAEILYSKSRSEDFESRVLNSYWYNAENDSYTITISEYYKGTVLSNLYVVMTFDKSDKGWQIVNFGYDV